MVGEHRRATPVRSPKPGGVEKWVVFVVGVCGVINEAFFTTSERPTLLLLFAAMMGLPGFISLDNWRRGKSGRE